VAVAISFGFEIKVEYFIEVKAQCWFYSSKKRVQVCTACEKKDTNQTKSNFLIYLFFKKAQPPAGRAAKGRMGLVYT
jgi:hypothetical protein